MNRPDPTNQRKEGIVPKDLFTLARQPKDNQELTKGHWTITLITHDYPGKTAALWNAVYRAYELDIQSAMFVVKPDRLVEALAVLRQEPRYLGGGVGVGLKEGVVDQLDILESIASAVGSVNTIRKDTGNSLVGTNTDGEGYVAGLQPLLDKRGWQLTGLEVLILGSGGTANAIAYALAQAGANLAILNRTMSKAEALAEAVNALSQRQAAEWGGEDEIANRSANAHLIINTTTKGATGPLEKYAALAPAILPATPANLAVNHQLTKAVLAKVYRTTIISDVVLGAGQTPTLQLAADLQLSTLDGLPMVKYQAIEAFWFVHERLLTPLGVTKNNVAKVMETVTI